MTKSKKTMVDAKTEKEGEKMKKAYQRGHDNNPV
jgi:hypothetical protein